MHDADESFSDSNSEVDSYTDSDDSHDEPPIDDLIADHTDPFDRIVNFTGSLNRDGGRHHRGDSGISQ